jgi:HTH-type transcriptional repressor of NAD biosynthesis genes
MIEGVKLVCFYGPESTGKSTMAKHFASLYQTVFVPEVARELVTTNDFNREDIISIGREQTTRIFQQLKRANRLLFCDSDLITTQIYSRHYLKVVPPILYQLEEMVPYDHYFLFDIDVPWVADGLRDLKGIRKEMFEVFKTELQRRSIGYTLVQGNWEVRARTIKGKIDQLLLTS